MKKLSFARSPFRLTWCFSVFEIIVLWPIACTMELIEASRLTE